LAARKIKIDFKKNIREHYLVNDAKILNEKQVENLCKQYNISLSQLPVMTSKDPLTKALEAEAGDVIQIIRKSDVTGSYDYYRRVL
tara:strand:+ start:235 stop:492 length:258 start_codon:yes stop_codon:yes gene_type:complete